MTFSKATGVYFLAIAAMGCFDAGENHYSISGKWIVLSSPNPAEAIGFYSISETRFVAMEFKLDSCYVALSEGYTVDKDSIRLRSDVFVYSPIGYRKSYSGDSLFLEYPQGTKTLGLAGSDFPEKCLRAVDGGINYRN